MASKSVQDNPWNCSDRTDDHRCGLRVALRFPRCLIYEYAWNEAKYTKVVENRTWHEMLPKETMGQRESPKLRLARPRNCIQGNELLGSEEIEKESFQYLAVSYAWDPLPTKVKWQDREVTEQSLKIAELLSKHTSLPLWIDAICIPQDGDLSIKMQEIRKMADIYRGAAAVLCLIPDMEPDAADIVRQAAKVINSDSYAAVGRAEDVYGCYMLATAGEHNSIRKIFQSRWWERAWTFQEAVLNKNTFLIGPKNETILISDLWKIGLAIHEYSELLLTTSNSDLFTLGKSATFWDSVATMTTASSPSGLTLGDAIGCVWRRKATNEHDLVYSMLGVCGLEDLHPDYNTPFNDVLISFFGSAIKKGDFSWFRWCDDDSSAEGGGPGVVVVPKPNDVYNSSATTSISNKIKWQSSILRKTAPPLGAKQVSEVWHTVLDKGIGHLDDMKDALDPDAFARLSLDLMTMLLDDSLPLPEKLFDIPGWAPHCPIPEPNDTSGTSSTLSPDDFEPLSLTLAVLD